MLETDTFLTYLYVMTDDYCKTVAFPNRPGPDPALSPAEAITLALMGQWSTFPSQRAFYRWACRHLRDAFPQMPHRSQFNRQVRHLGWLLCQFSVHLAALLEASKAPYQVLDTTACPVRNAKRPGRGHLSGYANLSRSGRLGFYEGFHVLVAATASGIITGFGFGAATAKEQHLTEAFLYARAHQDGRLPSAGAHASTYLADKGFEGFDWQARWRASYRADVITPPKRSTRRAQWPRALRRQIAGLRQIIETVMGKLHGTFALERVRPHRLCGFWAALAAKVCLHNFCIWINRLLGRSDLAFANLIAW